MASESISNRKRKFVYNTVKTNDDNLAAMKRRYTDEHLKLADNNNVYSSESTSTSSDDESSQTNGFRIEDLNTSLLNDLEEENKLESREDKTGDRITDNAENKNGALLNSLSIELVQNINDEDIEETKLITQRHDSGNRQMLQDAQQLAHIGNLIDNSRKRTPILELHRNHKDEQEKKLALRKKYNSKYNLPTILYNDELLQLAEPLYDITNDVLSGKIQSPFYFEAKNAHESSKRGFLSIDEFRKLDLQKFQAGFYGLKRQLRIGEEIYTRFKDKLTSNKSKTLKWWGASDFANYVLAPEVLVSLAIQEMKMEQHSKDLEHARYKTYDLMEETVEFGLIVADTDPLESWELPLEEDLLRSNDLSIERYSSRRWKSPPSLPRSKP